METDERKFETSLDIKVLGYLLGSGKNEEKPTVIIRENAVEVKIPRERVVLGDIPEHTDDGKYRS